MIEALTAFGTIGIAWAAFYQLGQTRYLNIQRDTLDKCLMYETNPYISSAVKKLKKGRFPLDKNVGEITPDNYSNAAEYEQAVSVVLNFLDALSIGVDQGNFDETIVKAHMRPIIDHLTECLIDTLPAGVAYRKGDFKALIKLRNRWKVEDKYGIIRDLKP